jgi:2',3'-cyclic-nucleotide 2'-phosphodiesterase (5'-nucleotidase family)
VTGAEISYVNGGGLRAPIAAGDVTFNDIFSVFPFNNQIVTAEVTGQILLDMLEMAVMNYPEEDGSFPHMSGLTFSVNTAIDSSVKVDENGVHVSNNMIPKVTRSESTGLGHKYIMQQYMDLSGKTIEISNDNNEYCVTLPLL